jgi:hypothetical protein
MLETPDLSVSYNPIPKPQKKVKFPVPVKVAGKKTLTWIEVREVLKAKFFHAGITECELRLKNVCWRNTALGFAHTAKRRRLEITDLPEVALLYDPCHDVIEPMPPEKMKNIVKGLIKTRKVQP